MARWEVPVYLPRRSRSWFQSSRCRKCTCIVLIQIGVFFACGVLFENHTRILKGAISMNRSRLMRWGGTADTGLNTNQTQMVRPLQEEQESSQVQKAEETQEGESQGELPELLQRLQGAAQAEESEQAKAPQLGAPGREYEPDEPMFHFQKEQQDNNVASKILKGMMQEKADVDQGEHELQDQDRPRENILPGLLVNPLQEEPQQVEEQQPLVGLPPQQEPEIQKDDYDEQEEGQGQEPQQQVQQPVANNFINFERYVEQNQPEVDSPVQAEERNIEDMEQVKSPPEGLMVGGVLPVQNMEPERLQPQPFREQPQQNEAPTEIRQYAENQLPPVNQPLNLAPQQQPAQMQYNQPLQQNLPPINQPLNQPMIQQPGLQQQHVINQASDNQQAFNQPPVNQPPQYQQPPPPPANPPPPPPPPQANPATIRKNPLLWSIAFQDPSHPHVVDCMSGGIIRGYDANTPVNYFEVMSLMDNTVEDPNERRESFTRIHRQKAWLGGAGVDPGYMDIQSSGIGSTITTSLAIRNVLYTVIHELKRITAKDTIRILDVPCGDMVWMSQFLQHRGDIEYVGMDVVPDLIEHHRSKYAQYPNWKFIQGDIINNNIPGTFDLILSRHMTAHLTNRDTLTALEKFSRSGSTFLLATSYSKQSTNVDLQISNPLIMQTRFRQQNLELPPFSLSPPICTYEDVRLQNAYIALWKLPLTQVKGCSLFSTPIHNEQHGFYSCA